MDRIGLGGGRDGARREGEGHGRLAQILGLAGDERPGVVVQDFGRRAGGERALALQGQGARGDRRAVARSPLFTSSSPRFVSM